MDARRVSNFAGDLICSQIDNDDFRGVRQVETVRDRIDRQDIPTAFSADRDLVCELVRFIAERTRADQNN
jgi:hypothetical protein